MSEDTAETVAATETRAIEPEDGSRATAQAPVSDGASDETKSTATSSNDATDRHIAVAVPIRAVERNKRVAASVLAGGVAYKVFLWLLPFGLIVGGALGLSNADDAEDAAAGGGIPGAISNAIGDAARSADSESWWLFAVGVPLLLWAGFTGAKAVQLVHALVWDEAPPKPKPLQASLAFTGMACAAIAVVAVAARLGDERWQSLLASALTIAPIAGLWLWASLHLPHRDAPWKALLPGALLVAIGFEVLHEVVDTFLVSQLEDATALYGALGAVTTFIFFIYVLALLVVSAPILNSSIYEELQVRRDDVDDAMTTEIAPTA